MAAEETALMKGKSASALVGQEIAYPKNIRTIPYASYFQFMRWEYTKGVAEASAVTGARDVLSQSDKGFAKFAKDKVKEANENVFGTIESKSQAGAAQSTDITNMINAGFKSMLKTDAKNQTNAAAHNQRVADAQAANDYSGLFADGKTLELKDGTVISNPEQLNKIKDEAKKQEDGVQSMYWLPMPNEYSYKYGANWDNKFKLGTMAKFAGDNGQALKQMALTGLAGGSLKALDTAMGIAGEGVDEGAGGPVTGILSGAAQGAINPLGSTGDLTDPTNLLGMAGLAPNENAIQLFSNMTMRSFTLSFDLFARSNEEAKLIDQLIQNFKIGMHPYADKQGTGAVLGFPDIWVLKPKFNSVKEGSVKSIDHPQMPSTKLCALVGMNVNTTPANQFTTTDTGEFPIQSITLDFKETTALTQADFKGGNF
jgi:hypothetical protein